MAVYILNASTGLPEAFIETYNSLSWTRTYRTPGEFEMTINQNVPGAEEIQKGRLLGPRDEFFSLAIDNVFLIEQIEKVIEDSGAESEMLNVSGRSLSGMFQERIAIPPPGSSHDSQTDTVETLMKHYVDANAGPGAATERQIPNLSIATDQGRGTTRSYDARYQDIAKILEELSIIERYGYEITYNRDLNAFEFDVIVGEDKSTTVFFDVAFDTILKQRFLTTDIDRKTYAYVGGQGEGAARTIAERFITGTEPEGLARREIWIDARDQGTTAGLNSRGDAKLAETREEDLFEVEINKYGSFRYREDYNLGDFVTLKNDKWGVKQSAQIVGIKFEIDNNLNSSVITAEMERAYPKLTDRMKGLVPFDGTGRN